MASAVMLDHDDTTFVEDYLTAMRTAGPRRDDPPPRPPVAAMPSSTVPEAGVA